MDDARTLHSLLTEVTRLKAQLTQRDQTLAQRDQLIGSYTQQLTQRDLLITQHLATISQHTSTIATLTQERDEQHLEKLRLQMRLAQLLKQAYGPRADRLRDPAQMLLDFAQQLDTLPAETPQGSAADQATAGAAPADAPGPQRAERRLRTRGRRDLGELTDLPMIEKTYELTGNACQCPTCQQQRHKIGEEVTFTVEYLPGSFIRVKHIQYKYACRACEQEGFNPNIERAVKSGGSPIDKGLPGPGLLAYVATSKYADYLPLHRLETIFARNGFELDRSTMCLWMADVARIAKPIYDRMVQRVLQSHVLATDDTVMPLLEPGKARQARMWIYQGDEDHPYNVFDFTVSRARDGPTRFLKDFRQTLLADAYGGYDGIVLHRELPRAGCWSHARRKFVDAQAIAADLARMIVRRIDDLFAIEARAKNLTAADRLALRQTESRPILDALHMFLHDQKAKLLPKHPLAQAIGYTLNQWAELTLFTTDPAVPLHNNLAEQQMKRIALLRKNALFVATPRGGQTAAILSTLTSTCRRHEINPQAYLTQLLANLPDTPVSQLDPWLPDQWRKIHAPRNAAIPAEH